MTDKKKIPWAVLSGVLLTAAFPKIGWNWLAWIALVPLLIAVKDLSAGAGFRMGFITGLVHFLSLLYWLVPVMRTYGYLPMYLSVSVLFLFAAFLALFVGLFATVLTACGRTPARCLLMIPLIWVALEYIRSFLFSGFPWELLGYSQYNRLQLIQISDILGVYGLSVLIAFVNGAVLIACLYFTKRRWQYTDITKRLAAGSILALVLGIALTWSYGYWRLKTIDNLINISPKIRISVIQGNIDQALKWDPAFQIQTIRKYNNLSASVIKQQPDLIVWPESATPFYFLDDVAPSEMVLEGIQQAATDFLIGSPSFVRTDDVVEYFNSAYLISPKSKTIGKYEKTHLVPFGEYVPFKKWLPFLGKIVAQVGDFRAGQAGKTIPWKNGRIGVQICYEIIFPELSRALTQNNATLLINITNDAWFGKTSGPYQHFSMTVFRAVENRRALARSANTGISGFIDPAGRILASTPLLEEAVITRSIPLIKEKTIYSRIGDLFAQGCLAIVLLVALLEIVRWQTKRKTGLNQD
ncbi:MAG: apolipoprotein N-acyltransferase [Deltaproteobacteria bacterium]|nr:apolipoprotein N-acyltransferase [Deltaproteobacteria bacterium]